MVEGIVFIIIGILLVLMVVIKPLRAKLITIIGVEEYKYDRVCYAVGGLMVVLGILNLFI